MNRDYIWTEKYRPHIVEDCVLPTRLKNVFLSYVKDKSFPHLLLTGTAGVGKTTIAMALCEEIGMNYLFVNASDERGIDVLRTRIKSYASVVSLTGNRKAIIMDEADSITPEAQLALRAMIEEFSETTSFILTCNYKSKLIDAIHSRSTVVDFTLKSSEKVSMATAFMKRIEHILIKEGVKYDKKVLAALIQKYFPDYRRTINELQRLAVGGNIGVDCLALLDDIKKLDDLFSVLKEKDFNAMRKWVSLNSDMDPTAFFHQMFEAVFQKFKPESRPQAVLTLADYAYKSAFVADQQLNTSACLTEIMINCEVE